MHDSNTINTAISHSDDIFPEVLKFTKNISGPILDLGTGQGALIKKLIEQGHTRIYACDKHPEFFQVKGFLCDRCDFNHDVLPYAENLFDIVACIEVIEHLENSRYLMREIHRVLKEKGRVIISTPNSLSLRARLSFFIRGYSSYFKNISAEEETPHITMLTRFDLLRILKDTGFRLLKFIYVRGVIPKTHIYWQMIFPFLKGELFSDTVILLAEKL